MEKDAVVAAGQLLGYTGESVSGFEHLHFEIRDAPPEDPSSRWQRDTVHPLGVLPYSDPASVSGTVDVQAVDAQSDVYNVTVMVETTRHDVLGLELSVLDEQQQLVLQAGDTPTAATTWGYSVGPSSFVFQDWSRQWSHKDGSGVGWDEFGQGGAKECPFHAQHHDPPSCSHPDCPYSAHYHLDRADPEDTKTGVFNGVRVQLQEYAYYRAGGYWLKVSFEELVIPGGPGRITATLPLGTGMQAGAEVLEWEAPSSPSPPPLSPPTPPPPPPSPSPPPPPGAPPPSPPQSPTPASKLNPALSTSASLYA